MDKSISFLKYKFIALGLSGVVFVVFSVGTYMKGGFTWGIDFAGGVKITADFEKTVHLNDIRRELNEGGLSVDVQRIGKEELNEYVISSKLLARGESSEKSSQIIQDLINKKFKNVKVLGVETVGPAIGNFLKKSAMKLGIVAIVFMMLYLWFRFEFKYSAGVMVAVLHDVVFALLFCGFTGVEINIPIIAAILTIFGFSVNDTIVIFDRVRENIQIKSKQTYTQIIDSSIWETLSRTIITTLTVLFCVLSLYMIGEGTISDFALVMLAGLVSGTYSTIYIASPAVLAWEKFAAK